MGDKINIDFYDDGERTGNIPGVSAEMVYTENDGIIPRNITMNVVGLDIYVMILFSVKTAVIINYSVEFEHLVKLSLQLKNPAAPVENSSRILIYIPKYFIPVRIMDSSTTSNVRLVLRDHRCHGDSKKEAFEESKPNHMVKNDMTSDQFQNINSESLKDLLNSLNFIVLYDGHVAHKENIDIELSLKMKKITLIDKTSLDWDNIEFFLLNVKDKKHDLSLNELSDWI